MRAKLEAKRRPALSVRDIADIKQRLGLSQVSDKKIIELKEAFIKYDADGSGVVSNDEFRRLLPEVKINMAPSSLRRAFEHLDADHSGDIEFEDFLKWHFADKRVTVHSIEERVAMNRAKEAAKASRMKDTKAELVNAIDHARAVFKKCAKFR